MRENSKRRLLTLLAIMVCVIFAVVIFTVSASAAGGGVASVDGTEYATLQEAIDAAGAGDTVTLLSDVALTAGLEIAKDDSIVLDLNGYTISYESSEAKANAAINNKGTLVISDGSAAGTGKVTYLSTAPSAAYAYATNTITNTGSLTVDGGTIENTTAGGVSYAVDNNSSGGNASVTLNDGTITGVGSAIRQFANGQANSVTVNGGTVSGVKGAIFVQHTGNGDTDLAISGGVVTASNPSYGTILVNPWSSKGGTLDVTITGDDTKVVAESGNAINYYLEGNNTTVEADVAISGGTVEGTITQTVETTGTPAITGDGIAISGGSFTELPAEEFFAEDFKVLDNGDGTYGAQEKVYVASVDGKGYEAFEEALAAWKINGGTLKLLADIDNSATAGCVHVTAGMDMTLDLNGYKLTVLANGGCSVDGTNATHYVRVAGGTFNVTDTSAEQDGEFSFTYGGKSAAYLIEVVSGTVNMDAGTLTNEVSLNFGGSAIYVRDAGVFNMTGGTIDTVRGNGTYRTYPLYNYKGDVALDGVTIVSPDVVTNISGGTMTVSNSSISGAPISGADYGDQYVTYDGTSTKTAVDAPTDFTASKLSAGSSKTIYYTYAGAAADLIKNAAKGDYIVIRENAIVTTSAKNNGFAITIKPENGATIDGIVVTPGAYTELLTSSNADGSTTFTVACTAESALAEATDAAGTVTYHISISSAAKAAGNGGTVKLLKDLDSTSTQTINYSITLDLNGHSITVYKGYAIGGKYTYGALEVDSTGGGITVEVIDSVGGGSVANTYNTEKIVGYALYVGGADTNKMVIKGGTYTGPITTTAGTLEIVGGTFSADPTQWLGAGYLAVENTDGTYGVGTAEEKLAEIKTDLEAAIADLEAAIAAGDNDLAAKITALDAAYQAVDAAIRTEFANADTALKTELEGKLAEAKTTLQAAIDKVAADLAQAQADLEAADGALGDRIDALDAAYQAVDAAIRTEFANADTALKTELEGKLAEAKTTLQAAIDKVAADLAQAQADLEAADGALGDRIDALDAAYQAVDAAIRTEFANADTALKTELEGKLAEAQATLKAAIDKVEADLAQAQADLEAADGALGDRIDALDAAYQAADAAIRTEFANADTALKTELEGKLAEAKSALEAAIAKVQTNLNNAVADLENLIATEDGKIYDKIDEVIQEYKDADALLKSDLITKIEADDAALKADLEAQLAGAVDTLTKAIAVVQAQLDYAVLEIHDKIDTNLADIAEQFAALKEAYENADALINGEIADLKDADETLLDLLADIEAALIEADAALAEAIDAVQKNLDDAKAELEDAINTKADAETVEDAIANLESAYAAADAVLESGISALEKDNESIKASIEALNEACTEADKALADAIEAVEKALDKAVDELFNAILNNKIDIEEKIAAAQNAYAAADAVLGADITALKAENKTLAAALSELKTAYAVADSKLKAAIDTLEDKLNGAVSELEDAIANGDGILSSKIDTLENSYITADAVLQGKIATDIGALTESFNKADKVLEAAIAQVQKNLDDAKAELEDAIAEGDKDLQAKIDALNAALDEANTVLGTSITDDKAELESAYKSADEALQTALKELSERQHKANARIDELTRWNVILTVVICVVGVLSVGCTTIIVLAIIKKFRKPKTEA